MFADDESGTKNKGPALFQSVHSPFTKSFLSNLRQEDLDVAGYHQQPPNTGHFPNMSKNTTMPSKNEPNMHAESQSNEATHVRISASPDLQGGLSQNLNFLMQPSNNDEKGFSHKVFFNRFSHIQSNQEQKTFEEQTFNGIYSSVFGQSSGEHQILNSSESDKPSRRSVKTTYNSCLLQTINLTQFREEVFDDLDMQEKLYPSEWLIDIRNTGKMFAAYDVAQQ